MHLDRAQMSKGKRRFPRPLSRDQEVSGESWKIRAVRTLVEAEKGSRKKGEWSGG